MAYPATFLDIQNAVIAKLRLDATNDLAKVKDWINGAYAQVCVETEAISTSASLTLTANQSAYTLSTLSSAVVRIKQMTVLTAGQSDYGAPLLETSLEEILSKRQSGGSTSVGGSTATHYALLGLNDLELWPTPGSADTLLIYYVAQPTALSANGDVPVLQEPYASKLLEYGALAEAADFIRGADDPATQQYRSIFQDWERRFRSHLYRRAGGHMQQLAVVGLNPRPPHDRSADIRY